MSFGPTKDSGGGYPPRGLVEQSQETIRHLVSAVGSGLSKTEKITLYRDVVSPDPSVARVAVSAVGSYLKGETSGKVGGRGLALVGARGTTGPSDVTPGCGTEQKPARISRAAETVTGSAGRDAVGWYVGGITGGAFYNGRLSRRHSGTKPAPAW